MGRKILHPVLLFLVKMLLKVSVTGHEHVPPNGGLIVMINHIAFLDPAVVTAAFPRPVTSMAKAEAFSLPLWGPLVRLYGAIPVRRDAGDIEAVRQAIRVVSAGNALLIAPEGTRSPTYSLQPGKEGVVAIATRTGAPVIPVAVTGTHRSKRNWLRLRRAPVTVTIGRPFTFLPAARRDRRAATDEAMYRLAALLPEPFRGVYADLDRAAGHYTQAADGVEAPENARRR